MEVSISFPGALTLLSARFIVRDEMYWDQLLNDILQFKFHYLFEGCVPKNYIVLYLNDKKIDTLHDLKVKNNDSLNILSAISGG